VQTIPHFLILTPENERTFIAIASAMLASVIASLAARPALVAFDLPASALLATSAQTRHGCYKMYFYGGGKVEHKAL
jgi:hypothetical protein